LDIRIGRIVEVAKHPDADALYVEKIDVGKWKIVIIINYFLSNSGCCVYCKLYISYLEYILCLSRWLCGVRHKLSSLEFWDRGFESHSRHGSVCVRLFCVCVILCVRSRLATGWSLIQGVYHLYKKFYGIGEEARAQQRAVELLLNE
jgi:hypothetical protein